ncbi:circadian-associated transcriptional repressor isoform X1 [Bufo bufo]|uniref:circadian-associated transcriptional repressor isoform X1 n=2 Tax=Bufo bufo TaxID=8384 RepID=UPI001ABDAB00|nr:circadian-associated transcriptional repressor isoform X1 [Bufo bufo]
MLQFLIGDGQDSRRLGRRPSHERQPKTLTGRAKSARDGPRERAAAETADSYMEDTDSSDFLSSGDSVGSERPSTTTTTEQEGRKYVDFDVFLADPMEESSSKTEDDYENSNVIPNSRLTSADHPVLIRLENEYQARRTFWHRRSRQHHLYHGDIEGRTSCTEQSHLTNGESHLKQNKQSKNFVLQEDKKLEAPHGLKRQRKGEMSPPPSWWNDEKLNLKVSEGDRIFAQKCRELQGFIKPLTELLNGLKRGRYDRGLSSFQQSVAMDRIQRIVGVLQKPEMGERYLGTLLQVEMMLKIWFPKVTSSQSSFSSSSSDFDMDEPRYKMAKHPDISYTEKKNCQTVPTPSSRSMNSPPDHPPQAPLHSDCACCKERAPVLVQWPNMNLTWMHTAPICNPPISQVDMHHLKRAIGQELFGPNAPSCGIIFVVQNNQPSSQSHPVNVSEAEKPIAPTSFRWENREELPLRSQSAPAIAPPANTQNLKACKAHSHSLPLIPTCTHRPEGDNT